MITNKTNRINCFISWPAVTNTFLPANSLLLKKKSFNALTIVSGSAILPSPIKPLANSPFQPVLFYYQMTELFAGYFLLKDDATYLHPLQVPQQPGR